MSAAPIALVLPYPISANRYWATRVITPKGGGRPMAMTYVTPEAKAYKEQVGWIARAAGVTTPMTCRVSLDIRLYPNRPQDWQRRMRKDPVHWDDDVLCIDLGNAEKVLSDALQGIVYDDDKRIWQHTKKRMEPDGVARIEVTIARILPATPQMEIAA